jgi:hypothetical protein
MPTIPWMPGKTSSRARPATGAGEAVIMASKLEVRSLLSVPRFFLLSMVVWRQVRAAPGALGVSLRAEPMKRTFWTLSAWESRSALQTFSDTDPHSRIVARLRKVMKGSVFTFWDTDARELPADWDDATRRLTAEAAQ